MLVKQILLMNFGTFIVVISSD